MQQELRGCAQRSLCEPCGCQWHRHGDFKAFFEMSLRLYRDNTADLRRIYGVYNFIIALLQRLVVDHWAHKASTCHRRLHEKRLQHAISTVWSPWFQTHCMQWKRYESSNTRQQELRGNAIERHGSSVATPRWLWGRRQFSIFTKNIRFFLWLLGDLDLKKNNHLLSM